MPMLPSPLESRPRLALDDGLEKVLRAHVDLAVVLRRRKLDEALLARSQLPLLVIRLPEKKNSMISNDLFVV